MWASRPLHHDNDMPIDLRKKVVLQRDLEERQESSSPSRRTESAFTPKENINQNHHPERWPHPPVMLPVGNLYPFMSERYGVRCSLVNADENRGQDTKCSTRGTLETAIRKLHHNRQLKKATEPSKEERCRSTDIAFEDSKEKDESLEGKRSSSCPNLSVIKPKPSPIKPKSSPIKPKSSFIQRSSGYISDNTTEPHNFSITSSFHHENDEHSNSQTMCGAKKRKSFIPVYGDRALSPKRRPRSPVNHEGYFSPNEKRRHRSPVEHEGYFSHSEKRSRSPVEHDDYFSQPERRPMSPSEHEEYFSYPEERPQSPSEHEYFSHPEILLRRQLQQHSPSPYLVHVYDYYQQLVQRMREHSSPGMRLPPPVSPPSGDEETQLDGQRKRPCRALTGKHVRQGTGASISTLLTLRQKIQERQKAKEHEPRTGFIGSSNRNGSPKKNKSSKIKSKNPLHKIQNC